MFLAQKCRVLDTVFMLCQIFNGRPLSVLSHAPFRCLKRVCLRRVQPSLRCSEMDGNQKGEKKERELMEAFGIDSCDDIQSTPPPHSQPARANQEQEDKTLIHIHLIIVFLSFLPPPPSCFHFLKLKTPFLP